MKQVPYQAPINIRNHPAICSCQHLCALCLNYHQPGDLEVLIVVTMRNEVFTYISILEYGYGISFNIHIMFIQP